MADQPARTSPGESRAASRWPLWPGVVLLCLVHALYLSESLLGGKVLTQIDALCLFEPWASAAPEDFEASNVLLLDQSIAMLPWLEFSRERLAAGELPLWNPHNFAGQPLGGVPPACLWWPPNWIYFALPSWHFHAWHAWFRLVCAGTFMLVLLRELGLGRAAGLLGAIGFSLCGFNTLWLNHPHSNAAIFLPLLFWLVERAARRPSLRVVGGFALAIALILVSGHPQTATHLVLATGAFVLARLLLPVSGTRLSRRGITALVAGGIVGALLAMPQVLPLLEYLKVSIGARLSATVQLVADVDPGEALWFLIAPEHFGHPLEGTYAGPEGPHLNYQELAGVFAGRVALVLAGLGMVLRFRERSTWIFAGLALLAGLVAYQISPFYDALRLVPGVNNTKLLRMVLVVAFALIVLGSMGLDALLARLAHRAELARAVAVVVPLLAAAELVTWSRGYNPAIERDAPAFLPETPVTDFLARDESLFRVLGAEGSMLLPNANIFYGVDMLTGYDAIEYATLVELVSRLTNDPRAQQSLKEARYFDRLDRFPLASLLNVKYVLSTVPLPDPLVLVLDGPVRVYENESVLPRAFVAREWVVIEDAGERLDALSAPDFDPRTAILEARGEHHVPSVAGTAPPGTVRIESYSPREVELVADMQARGLVVLADSWDAGWRATVDGEERSVERVDHTLRGVWVEPGSSRIVMTYTPVTFRLAVGLALAGLGLAAFCLVRRPLMPPHSETR